VDAKLFKNLAGVGQHVHEMRNRSALIAGDVGYTGLEQRLGDGEDSLAVKLVAVAQLELADLFLERAFRHGCFFRPRPG